MSTAHQSAAESTGAMITKAGPPAGVSIATIAGINVSELVLWATLLYTVLMICHKAMVIWRDLRRAPARIQEGE